MAKPGERALTGELIVSMVIITVASIREHKAFPSPSNYVAAVTAFTFLAAMCLLGERPAKLAAGLGGLTTLTLFFSHGIQALDAAGSAVNQKVALTDSSAPSTQVQTIRAGFVQQAQQSSATISV